MFKIKYLINILVPAAMILCSGAAPAAAPRQISASYNVSLNGLPVAVINERFETEGNTYRIISESNTVGVAALFRRQSATLTSSGLVLRTGLRPQRFEGQNKGKDMRHAVAVFDWTTQRLTLNYDDRTETAALAPGTQDRISLMYQFMFLEFGKLKQIEVPMTNGRKLDQYRYSVTPDAEIDTPLGRIRTLHLVKQREPDQDSTEIWLSPQHHYFPVKVLIVEADGARYEQVLTRLDLRP
jgi:hypothetical protein